MGLVDLVGLVGLVDLVLPGHQGLTRPGGLAAKQPEQPEQPKREEPEWIW